ncbi:MULTISPECIES: linear amide C-N hydrolase [Dysgonomonas]|uniref:Linear amide C-N hydrolase n=1 Tax=Dysgonomonas capnocytophagoides TaxID=45254 RepID=A0A4Y8L1U8_9BACT|nr:MULTISPECIES: linear amide C-N hydrolase [Dysgonomonas]MBS7119669.1 linear amide C-N hydrolase [Dysgonomonas sp.]TFD96018.1 linear amide C-N hydrolase [Dysgonomonas capnocytophagoides]
MKKTFLLLAILGIGYFTTNACTRVVYKGEDNLILTARSMDWKEDIKSNIWVFPRGMDRDGAVGPNSLKWKSKYGSVITSAYDISSTDGINEKGLVANLLWLAESEYPTWNQKTPGLTIAAWVQYVLDSFATVDEAVKALEKQTFEIVSDKMPDGSRMATLHLSISDALGDNAIFEYIGGKLVIHHDKSYQVMTNSPIFDKQLALNEYWKEIGGTVMLPGTNRAADRFVRASFYTNAIPKTSDTRIGVASVFSVIRNCSVPFGISTPDQPNISSTRWRTVSDHKNLVYFYESVLTPNTFWLELKDIDFSENASVKKLNLENNETYKGNAASSLVNATPFVFAGI